MGTNINDMVEQIGKSVCVCECVVVCMRERERERERVRYKKPHEKPRTKRQDVYKFGQTPCE